MRGRGLALAALSLGLLAVSGCGPQAAAPPASESAAARGRFAGVGVFDAGPVWSRMVTPDNPKQDERLARLSDDEHIIVVVDSQTGEIRQCGDHSGYCVAMQPWRSKAGARPILPALLTSHIPAESEGDVAPEATEAPVRHN